MYKAFIQVPGILFSFLLSSIIFVLSFCAASMADDLPGSIAGTAAVSLGGSSQYSIPIPVPDGTSGMRPKFILTYDSNYGPGNLGAGWTVSGISYITRAGKSKAVDNEVGPINFSDLKTFSLDGVRLVEAENGSSVYLKINDDQTSIEQRSNGTDVYFIARTKAGLRMYYGETENSKIKTSSGKIVSWACNRIEDTFGNTIEYEYISNGYGDWGLLKATYTSNPKLGLKPYAALTFSYHESATPIISFVSGEKFLRTLVLDKIESGTFDDSGKFNLFRRLSIAYEETGRSGSRLVKAITETGGNGETHRPTQFMYADPKSGWLEQANFSLPTEFGGLVSLEDGYRTVDLSNDGTPEIIYSADFNDPLTGAVRPHRRTYKLTGTAWSLDPQLNLPEALTATGGGDLGGLFYDVDGDGFVDFLLARLQDGVLVSKAYRNDSGKWVETPGFSLPFALSEDGQAFVPTLSLTLENGSRGLLTFDPEVAAFNDRLSIWSHSGTGWQRSPVLGQIAINPTEFLEVDIDCDGKKEVAALDDRDGSLSFLTTSTDVDGHFQLRPLADISLEGPIQVAATQRGGCGSIIALNRTKQTFTEITVLNGKALATEIVVPGITAQSIARFAVVRLEQNGDDYIFFKLNDVVGTDATLLRFASGTSTWERLTDYDIPVASEADRISSSYLPFAVDINEDGSKDIVLLPTTQVLPSVALINRRPGFQVIHQYIPDITFSEKDKLGIAPQFVDVNGDGLVDVVAHFSDDTGKVTSAASVNSANGWIGSSDYIPPLPLANSKSGSSGVLIDVTSDGIADFMYAWGGIHRFFRNVFEKVNGQDVPRYWVEDSSFPPPPENLSAERLGDLGARFVDLNADGRVDMLVSRRETSGSSYSKAYVNTGTAWTEDSSLRLPAPFVSRFAEDVQFENASVDYYRDLRGQFIDINGDGLIDYVFRYRFGADKDQGSTEPSSRQCHNVDETKEIDGSQQIVKHPIPTETTCAGAFLNTGKRWIPAGDRYLPPVDLDLDVSDKAASLDFVDINGDSLTDVLVGRPNGASQTFLNTANGWSAEPTFKIPEDVIGSDPKLKAFRLLDLDADGLVDLVYARPGFKTAYLNNGHGWAIAPEFAPPFDLVDQDGKDLGVRTIDVDGNGRPDFLRSWDGASSERVRSAYLNLGGRADTLSSVVDGLGLQTNFSYRSLLQLRTGDQDHNRFYTPAPVSTYPIISFVPTLFAVEKATVIESSDRELITSYRYNGMRFDLTHGMPMGFESRQAKNEANGIVDTTNLYQVYFLVGKTKSDIRNAQGVEVQRNDYVFESIPSSTNKSTRVVLKSSDLVTRDLTGAEISRTKTTAEYDAFSNATNTCIEYGDGSWSFSINEYDNSAWNVDPSRWFLGRLKKTTVVHASAQVDDDLCILPTAPTADRYQVNVATFAYDRDTGVLTTETANAQSPLSLTTSYVRDQYGNIVQTRRRDNYFRTERVTSSEFDLRGRFVEAEKNALGHRIARKLNEQYGTVETSIDPNGIVLENQHDGFGNLISSRSATGVETRRITSWAQDEIVAGQRAIWKASEQTGELPPVETLLDIKGRPIRVTRIGNAGKTIYQDTLYDEHGRIAGTTLPYFSGGSELWLTTYYDVLDRPVKKTRSDGAVVKIIYEGLTTTYVDPLGRSTKKIFNAKGLVSETVDSAGNSIFFRYGPADRLLRTVQVDGREIVSTFDEAGNRISSIDPDLGHWDYKYNAFGDVVWQRDAKGQITTIDYDQLGRPVVRATEDKRTTWAYDDGSFAKGAVVEVESSDGYAEFYDYDRYGRLVSRRSRIDGELFSTSMEYDQYSRPVVAYYPGGFSVKNSYDHTGALATVSTSDPTESFGSWEERWSSLERDQFGRVVRERYGNGVVTARQFDPLVGNQKQITVSAEDGRTVSDLSLTYDLAGNLEERRETASKSMETFKYDALYRLSEWRESKKRAVSYQYDSAGRITYKSDVGYYSYDEDKPSHAVGSISEKLGGRAKSQFEYDANGNTVLGPNGYFQYFADNSVRAISTAVDNWSVFAYAPDGTRYKHDFQNRGMLTRTVTSGAYERISEHLGLAANGRPDFVRHRLYVSSSEGVVAILERTAQFDPYGGEIPPKTGNSFPLDKIAKLSSTIHYLVKDQLGSISSLLDNTGQITVAFKYDPWGKRSMDDRGKTVKWPGEAIEGSMHKGFTGHEHLDHLNLIHMNGRVYDPTIARFVSADPTLQFPMISQNYDRYAYVGNNPLRFIDPNGFGWFDDFVRDPLGTAGKTIAAPFEAVGKWLEKNWRTAVVVVVAVAITYFSAGTLGPVAAGMLAGAASSGLSTALNGGNFSDVLHSAVRGAVIGGISAGFAYGIGELGLSSYGAAAAHGASQGALNAMQGGDFWQSFSAGAFGSLAGSYMQSSEYLRNSGTGVKIGAGAIVGGTVSVIGGGKFANGAVTGAFVVAFNHLMDHSKSGRALTAYEIQESKKVFGDKIEYSKVRVYDAKYLPWQGEGYVMSPDGNIYWPGCGAQSMCGSPGTFIHEMTHVMQVQHDVNVLLRGAILQIAKFGSLGFYDPYQFTYDPNRSFSSYNIEQQGDYAERIYSRTLPNTIDY